MGASSSWEFLMKRDSRPGVCIIVENQPVPFDRRVWQEARALLAAGYRVSIISPKAPGCEASRETLEGIEIYRHWTWGARGRAGYMLEYGFALMVEFYLAWKVYARSRFSVLHGCNPPDTIFLIALAFKPLGVRFVFDHHDLSPELYEAKFEKLGWMYKIVRLAERLTFRAADLSIATNGSYKNIAIERGKMKPEKVLVVQTCEDQSEVNRVQQKPQLKRGKRHMVLYVGVMERQDGLRLLIESIKYLVKQKGRKDIQFVLVGSGTELPVLKKLATESGVDDFVEFTGLLPHQEVGPYMATADVCVAPDPLNPLNNKSTMIKILEYMAYGRPIVLYELEEGRRTAGEGALYARPNDATDFAIQIEKLLDSEQLRKNLGEFGRKRTREELNWKIQSARLVGAYASLVAASNLPRESNSVERLDREAEEGSEVRYTTKQT
jgi:glycosyltransferase involved in cell wall biosynthesis